jgi:16S rRNA (uracil1498-N3)-methyltransferase
MRLFLSDDCTGTYATLTPDESKHCVRVLRMQLGDELYVTSGDGTMCRALIANPDPTACEVEIVERIADYDHRPFHLHIAIAPPKNNARTEWFVEKAVEIGIDRITPIICEHSERGVLKTDRLERIALSAMKQSLQATLPQIDPPTPLTRLLDEPLPTCPLVCYCVGDDRRTLHQLYTPGTDALVLIGPEGDFSPDEISRCLSLGIQPVTLGNNRLRTETAALYALTTLNFLNTLS